MMVKKLNVIVTCVVLLCTTVGSLIYLGTAVAKDHKVNTSEERCVKVLMSRNVEPVDIKTGNGTCWIVKH